MRPRRNSLTTFCQLNIAFGVVGLGLLVRPRPTCTNWLRDGAMNIHHLQHVIYLRRSLTPVSQPTAAAASVG